jgi:valyl-tRNA synthetase
MEIGQGYIRSLARVDDLRFGMDVERPAEAATQVAGDVEILLPLAGLIDVAEEHKRLEKEIARIEKDVAMFSKKLSNEAFLAKAPPEVLEKDRSNFRTAWRRSRRSDSPFLPASSPFNDLLNGLFSCLFPSVRKRRFRTGRQKPPLA